MRHVCASGTPRIFPAKEKFNVDRMVEQLDANPQLWNEHAARTRYPTSPHREADDLWVRYNAVENYNPADPAAFNRPHLAVWYPSAALLPHVREFSGYLAAHHQATGTGAVLITRVPAGKRIHWHSDHGWHAASHRKFLLLLRGNAEQSFEFEGEQLYAEAGDCFEFQNEYAHRVLNPTDQERISLIVCLRGVS